jgi:hypothetical protein
VIDAWWFASAQTGSGIPQPEFFLPQSHCGVYAELGGTDTPLTVHITAFAEGKEFYDKTYGIDDEQAVIYKELGTVKFMAAVDTGSIEPDRLSVEISAGDCVLESKEIVCEYITMSGIITDFDGKPFPAAVILSRYDFGGFEAGFGVWSGGDGAYSLSVPAGLYNAVFVGDASYKVSALEGWGWHMLADGDERHDF